MKIDEEFKSLIPPLTDEEKKGLKESLLNEGCRDALVLWNDILIDGHNRYEICTQYDIPFATIQMEFANRDEVKLWMMKNQLARRNLNTFQRLEIVEKFKPIIAEKAKERMLAGKANPQQKSAEGETRDQLAQLANTSHDTVHKAEKIINEAPEEVKSAVRSGDMSINQAYKTVKAIQKKEKAEEKAARKADYKIEESIPEGYCILYTADIRKGLLMIPKDSVDFIITDPPYPREYLDVFNALSEEAARVLKPGGSLIVMSGQSYLPEVIKRLSECMKYHWCLSYLTPGGQSPRMIHKKVNTFWKPVLWYVKGEYNGDHIGDVLKSAVNDNDKRFHKWGQSCSGMADIVDRFTNPGDIILDPFLGGGTTGVVAIATGRKFIGVDIDEENVNKSRQRIEEAYSNGRS